MKCIHICIHACMYAYMFTALCVYMHAHFYSCTLCAYLCTCVLMHRYRDTRYSICGAATGPSVPWFVPEGFHLPSVQSEFCSGILSSMCQVRTHVQHLHVCAAVHIHVPANRHGTKYKSVYPTGKTQEHLNSHPLSITARDPPLS